MSVNHAGPTICVCLRLFLDDSPNFNGVITRSGWVAGLSLERVVVVVVLLGFFFSRSYYAFCAVVTLFNLTHIGVKFLKKNLRSTKSPIVYLTKLIE